MGSISETPTVVPLIINGKEKFTSKTFSVVSPSTNEVCWTASSADDESIDMAIVVAEQAFSSWSTTKPALRRKIFIQAHNLLKERVHQSRQISQTETAASDAMFDFEYHTAVDLLLHIAGLIPNVEGSIPELADEDSYAMVLKEPYGVVLAIAPWNAPHILGLRSCIGPLAAGNTVILKGPELSPRTYHHFVMALHDAGLPPGCLSLLFHAPEDAASLTQRLIAHPAIQKVNFTGSSVVGAIVAGLCGQHIKPCLMELGGKAPAIVCEDADLQLAAEMCAMGAFHHSGQICMSTERIIVHDRVAEEFWECLKQVMERRTATEPSGSVLISPAAVARNRELVRDALAQGATVVFGDATAVESRKTHMHPVILSNITTSMKIHYTESFGPTTSLYTFRDDAEAIALANDTAYGLTAAIFTRDLRHAFKLAREIKSGAVHINGPTIHDEPVLPHGGVKASGFGRFGGRDGLGEWTRTKTVTWRE